MLGWAVQQIERSAPSHLHSANQTAMPSIPSNDLFGGSTAMFMVYGVGGLAVAAFVLQADQHVLKVVKSNYQSQFMEEGQIQRKGQGCIARPYKGSLCISAGVVARMQVHLLFMRDIMLVIHNSVGDRKQRVSFYNAVAAHVAVVRCRMQKGSRERRQSGYALAGSSTDSPMENQGELLHTPLACLLWTKEFI